MMRKIFFKILIGTSLILTNIFMSFANDINNQILKLENQMNIKVREFEENYNKQIQRTEKSLEQAKINLANQENTANIQVNIAASRATQGGVQVSDAQMEDIKDDVYRKFKSNIDSAKNQVLILEIQLKDLINNKSIEINKIKNQYQQQIDNYNIEKNNLLNQNNSIENNQTINNNVNSNNSCGLNSYLTSYGKCDCNVGYFWEDVKDMKNFNCVKQTDTQMCQEIYGFYSYGDKDYCYCSTGYTWNTGITACIKEIAKTPTELCQADFGINSYSDGIKTKDGKYNCVCKSGYVWDSNDTVCIRTSVKIEDINLSDKNKEQIEKFFATIKIKNQQYPVGKREQKYEKIAQKLESILLKQSSEKTKNILLYLKFLIDMELINIDQEIDLKDLFGEMFGN